MANELQVKKNVGDQVISRVNALCEAGFTMPKDYNYVNAIKMSMLILQDLKDKNGKPALEVCTPNSISSALFKMVTRGLNASLSQCYLLVRGNQLCLQDSYYGKVLMVKRIYPNWNPIPVVIREGDVFELGIDATTGRKFVIKHETKLENIDKPFVGGYMYLPDGELFVMTKKQIMTAWSKSSSREQAVHKTFDEKMVGKTLVNSGCNMVINATPQYAIAMDEETQIIENKLPDTEVDEQEAEVVEVQEGTVVEEQQHEETHENPQPQSDPMPSGDDDF